MEKAVLKEEVQNAEDVIKLTALVYFREALQKQDYENCAELLESARQAGALQDEISAVISDYLRADRIEANKKRLRVIREV